MTVKPPGGPTAAPPTPPEEIHERAPASESFQSKLDASDVPAAAGEIATEVAKEVREGGMSIAQAVDRLVDRTLADPAFARLGAERLEALRTELRELIASDPTLKGLADQIAR
jgi:hypothetical protein